MWAGSWLAKLQQHYLASPTCHCELTLGLVQPLGFSKYSPQLSSLDAQVLFAPPWVWARFLHNQVICAHKFLVYLFTLSAHNTTVILSIDTDHKMWYVGWKWNKSHTACLTTMRLAFHNKTGILQDEQVTKETTTTTIIRSCSTTKFATKMDKVTFFFGLWLDPPSKPMFGIHIPPHQEKCDLEIPLDFLMISKKQEISGNHGNKTGNFR